ncbi:hypothetical protein OEZ86_011909 [Tetradesmus obliquus]|nr:hypothetical protein OEZ86_011909 [Tetradesmus obliquus]
MSAMFGLRQVDGEVFGPGDDVYLALDEFDNDEEEEEACEVCGSSSSKRGNAILECSTCLRGFHLRCLMPRLKAVPDGDWLCADCNAGRVPPPPNKLVTRWQKLLYGKEQLALVHVLGCVRGKAPNGTEEDQLLVRYYILPQETHTGRLSSHGARELFLGCKTFVEPAHAAVGRAYVHHPQHFEEREEEGNDVFLCAYEYDEDWKRFKLRKQRGADGGEYEDACPTTPMLAGLSRGRDDYSSEADDSEDGSEGGEDDYRPDYGARGKAAAGKRRRGHGQLPAALAAAAGRFAGLGAAALGQQQQQLEQRDAFARLHASMSLACVPASLPCRHEERGRLQGFVRRALHEDGGILYICGVPGTGKTALVKEVLAGVREEARAAGTQFASINCLQLPSPQHVFSRLWEKLSGQHMGPARARDALMQLFGVGAGAGSSRRRYSTIIVLDEIDMLMTKDQAVLYQLFDWPSQPGSRLAIIGISNTHDLDQRVLPRIASRLDQAKLAFAPYAVAQLVAIVQDRLESSGVAGAVEQAAVEIACRKVAAETGDAVAERAANSIASLVDLTPPSLGVLQHCLVRLAGVRLLLSDGVHVKAHVALNVDKDDLALAVKDDARLARLQSLL